MQIKPVKTPPTNEMLKMSLAAPIFNDKNLDATRKIPKLPNFKRTPARTMEPATGASTCALGSQRWVKNMGVFTRKAAIKIIHHMLAIVEKDINCQNGKINAKWPPLLKIFISDSKRGRDAVTVYKIRYTLA